MNEGNIYSLCTIPALYSISYIHFCNAINPSETKTPIHARATLNKNVRQNTYGIHAVLSPSYNPLVFSGSILTSSPLISLTVSNAGLPAYNCCCCWLDCASSTSWVTPSGLFPRNRLRISIIPRLEAQKNNVNYLAHFRLF